MKTAAAPETSTTSTKTDEAAANAQRRCELRKKRKANKMMSANTVEGDEKHAAVMTIEQRSQRSRSEHVDPQCTSGETDASGPKTKTKTMIKSTTVTTVKTMKMMRAATSLTAGAATTIKAFESLRRKKSDDNSMLTRRRSDVGNRSSSSPTRMTSESWEMMRRRRNYDKSRSRTNLQDRPRLRSLKTLRHRSLTKRTRPRSRAHRKLRRAPPILLPTPQSTPSRERHQSSPAMRTPNRRLRRRRVQIPALRCSGKLMLRKDPPQRSLSINLRAQAATAAIWSKSRSHVARHNLLPLLMPPIRLVLLRTHSLRD